MEANNKVYFLGYESTSQDSRRIYPAIRQYSSNMVYVPNNDLHVNQFLRVKEHAIDDHIDQLAVSGVEYGVCILDVYHLLLGEESPEFTKEDYQNASEKMGWSHEKFVEKFNTRVNAIIREELTDKLFNPYPDLEEL